MSQYAVEAWVRSGQAAEAAQNVAWFVILMVGLIGVVIWLDMKKDK